jgi:PAS domain S-box-containing protein
MSINVSPQNPGVSGSAQGGAFALFCTDQGRINWVSPEFTDLIGYDVNEVQGLPIQELLLASEAQPDSVAWLFSGLAQQKHVSGLLPYCRKDGATVWVNVALHPVVDTTGRFVHFLVLHSFGGPNQVVQEQTQAYVDRLERQRNVLVREVHHRIKNSLQGVAGMLRQHAQAEPVANHVLEKAIAQIRTIAVVHGLEGKALYNEVVLCEMAPSIARMVQELVLPDGPQFTVTVNVPERIRVCEQERVPIALILNELILNAAKHLASHDACSRLSLSVCWQANSGSARITINNSGQLPEGFDFASESGTGTGLELVSSMLPAQGATIAFTNQPGYVQTQVTLAPPVIYSVHTPG